MAVKTVNMVNNTIQDLTRGPSPSIWNQPGAPGAWWADFEQDPRTGIKMFEDFIGCGISPATGSAANFGASQNWYVYLDTNGAITDSGIYGGGIHLAASTTAHQGVALGSLTNPFQIQNSSGTFQGRLSFECRVQNSTASVAASTSDMFLGLVDASGLPASAVPITHTGGTLSTAPGFIGFHKRGGATHGLDFDFVYNLAGGTPTYTANLGNIINTVTGTAMAGATFYKLGFVFNPNAEKVLVSSSTTAGQTAGTLRTPLITVYVNGQIAAAFISSDTGGLTTAAFPITFMTPTIAWMQQSTTASVNADVDWIYAAQQSLA